MCASNPVRKVYSAAESSHLVSVWQHQDPVPEVRRTHLLPDRHSPPSSKEPIALALSIVEAMSRANAFVPAATPVIFHAESDTGKTFFANTSTN
jgi:hypothetical protein